MSWSTFQPSQDFEREKPFFHPDSCTESLILSYLKYRIKGSRERKEPEFWSADSDPNGCNPSKAKCEGGHVIISCPSTAGRDGHGV